MISSHSRKNTCHKFLRLLKEGIAFRKGGLLYEDFFIQGYLYRSAIGSKRRCTASLLATLVSAPFARVRPNYYLCLKALVSIHSVTQMP